MPLFKGKGCKSTPGKAIAYITDENKAEIVSSQNLDDNQDYAQQFRETADLYGKGEKFDERKYYHFKLSCDRADEVSAEAHHEFAEAMAARCFPEFECVIATHTDTETVLAKLKEASETAVLNANYILHVNGSHLCKLYQMRRSGIYISSTVNQKSYSLFCRNQRCQWRSLNSSDSSNDQLSSNQNSTGTSRGYNRIGLPMLYHIHSNYNG